MKLTANTTLLLMTGLWLSIAQSNVKCALRCTGMERARHLINARDDAARYVRYAAMWKRESLVITAA